MRKLPLFILCIVSLTLIAFIIAVFKKESPYAPTFHKEFSNSTPTPEQLAEIQALHPALPQKDNAAEYFIRAHDAYKEMFSDADSPPIPILGENDYELTLPVTPLPTDMLDNINTILTHNQKSLRLIQKGSTAPFNKVPVDYSLGLYTEHPHLAPMRNMARLTQLAALYHAEKNDTAQATQYLLHSLTLAQSLDQVPVLISTLVHLAVIGGTLDVTEQVLNRTQLSQSQLLQLQQTLAAFDELKNARIAYQGDNWQWQVLFSPTQEEIIEYTKKEMFHEILDTDRANNTYEEKSKMKDYYRNLEKEIQNKTLTEVEIQAATTKLNTRFDEIRRSSHEIYSKNIEATQTTFSNYYTLTQQEGFNIPEDTTPDTPYFSVLSRFTRPILRCEAQLRLAQTAIAIERYMLDNNTLPNTLQELAPIYIAPETLLDPYNDHLLTYTIADDHYTLSCQDDPLYTYRAKLEGYNGIEARPDITFTVYHASLAPQ